MSRASSACSAVSSPACLSTSADRQTKRRKLVSLWRKCLHLYHYAIDPVFGFMRGRLQTWCLFNIQICSMAVNGRLNRWTKLSSATGEKTTVFLGLEMFPGHSCSWTTNFKPCNLRTTTGSPDSSILLTTRSFNPSSCGTTGQLAYAPPPQSIQSRYPDRPESSPAGCSLRLRSFRKRASGVGTVVTHTDFSLSC